MLHSLANSVRLNAPFLYCGSCRRKFAGISSSVVCGLPIRLAGRRKTHRAFADLRVFRPLRRWRPRFFRHRRRETAIPFALAFRIPERTRSRMICKLGKTESLTTVFLQWSGISVSSAHQKMRDELHVFSCDAKEGISAA